MVRDQQTMPGLEQLGLRRLREDDTLSSLPP
jgi:hypothetical protein